MTTDHEVAAAAKAMRDIRREIMSLPLERAYERLAKAGLEAAARVRFELMPDKASP